MEVNPGFILKSGASFCMMINPWEINKRGQHLEIKSTLPETNSQFAPENKPRAVSKETIVFQNLTLSPNGFWVEVIPPNQESGLKSTAS